MIDKALEYHCLDGVPGKLSVVPTKPCMSAEDLSYAYTPGVAKPVLEIEKDSEEAYHYTDKGNLVAVVSNGTAILGLGDRGALASKPVMEGKGVLFKRFADIDVYDIEVDEKEPDKLVAIVKAISPTFGGINLEDIKGPECFRIEKALIEECDIPVFHDDQHGTAIIATAGLMNACEIVGKDISSLRVVVNGAGAAGISCARMFIAAGVRKENLVMLDSRGVIYKGRASLTPEKAEFASDTAARTLAEAMVGADVFMGLSVADCVSAEMLRSMAKDPIVFAMANPNPEITYEKAMATRDDVVMATGRSDYPNQINNVLGFPFIFALAALAKEPVPEIVSAAYGGEKFTFGRKYIVPKPFDPRVIEREAVAVAQAAVADGVARRPIEDWDAYRASLKARMAKYWA